MKTYYWTFDDWENGKLTGRIWRDFWLFGYGETNIPSFKNSDKLEKHILPKEEYDKIAEKRKEIFESHVSANLEWYKQDFGKRVEKSLEKEKFTEIEFRRYDDILEGNNLTNFTIFYNEGRERTFEAYGKNGEMAKWYRRICISGEDVTSVIEPTDEGDFSRYIPQVTALVLYHYRAFLKGVLEGFQDSSANLKPSKKMKRPKTKTETPIELPDLETALVSPDKLPSLWQFLVKKQGAVNKEFFDLTGYAGSDKRNASPLMGLATGLRLSDQIKGGFDEKQVYQILCKRFNVTPTKEPHKTIGNANFNDVKDWVTEFFNK